MTQLDLTYQDYIENWESQYGDDEEADTYILAHGVRIPTKVSRLSEEEFQEHLKEMNNALVAFDVALKANDDQGMESALRSSFPHEVALLI